MNRRRHFVRWIIICYWDIEVKIGRIGVSICFIASNFILFLKIGKKYWENGHFIHHRNTKTLWDAVKITKDKNTNDVPSTMFHDTFIWESDDIYMWRNESLKSSRILHSLLVLCYSINISWWFVCTLKNMSCLLDIKYWINVLNWMLNFFPYSTFFQGVV